MSQSERCTRESSYDNNRVKAIMHSGGWNDPKMPRYYTRELAAQESGMARMMRANKTDAKQ
jgi:hypothetical protein